jgi:hypothetical protein
MASPNQGAPWIKNAIAGRELVTDDEMLVVLGQPVTGREEGGYYGCRWTTESNQVDVRVFPDSSLPADSCDEGQTALLYGLQQQGLWVDRRQSNLLDGGSRGTDTITLPERQI